MGELLFCCPLCGGALTRQEHRAVCPQGHSFDVARQGYVHLLPVNKMHSKLPGDSREMVESRRRFFRRVRAKWRLVPTSRQPMTAIPAYQGQRQKGMSQMLAYRL